MLSMSSRSSHSVGELVELTFSQRAHGAHILLESSWRSHAIDELTELIFFCCRAHEALGLLRLLGLSVYSQSKSLFLSFYYFWVLIYELGGL